MIGGLARFFWVGEAFFAALRRRRRRAGTALLF
jgi:hypothetical protein